MQHRTAELSRANVVVDFGGRVDPLSAHPRHSEEIVCCRSRWGFAPWTQREPIPCCIIGSTLAQHIPLCGPYLLGLIFPAVIEVSLGLACSQGEGTLEVGASRGVTQADIYRMSIMGGRPQPARNSISLTFA